MIVFVARRLLHALPILLGVAVLVFITIKLVPGDPVSVLAGPTATAEVKAEVAASLGLDRPLHEQFFSWFTRVVVGDFGRSTSKQTPAAPLVWGAFGNTLVLAGAAALLAIVLGVALGSFMAARPDSLPARAMSATTTLFVSFPQYTLALLLVVVVGGTLRWLPTSGMTSPGGGGPLDVLAHLVLPALTAGLLSAGVIARSAASALAEGRASDWAEAYRARGVGPRRIYLHTLHNALPSLLAVAGLQVGYLLGGVVFVETIFSWPGVGLLVYQAVSARDMPLIVAGVLVASFAFIVINIVVDSVHAAIDPRVRAAHA